MTLFQREGLTQVLANKSKNSQCIKLGPKFTCFWAPKFEGKNPQYLNQLFSTLTTAERM